VCHRLFPGLVLKGLLECGEEDVQSRGGIDLVPCSPDVIGQSTKIRRVESLQRRRHRSMPALPHDGRKLAVGHLDQQRVRQLVTHTGITEILHQQAGIAKPSEAAEQLRLT
jgi:hypothetical protein